MNPLRRLIYWFGGWLFDFTKFITILVFVGLIANYFLYTILIVKGDSMLPNYKDGDIMVVDRIEYRLSSPQRYDAIALYFPGEVEKKFIKRIIGLPGDNVTIANNHILIDGQPLNEPYLNNQVLTRPDMTLHLNSDEYFVLGDNRDVSSDSRIWGPLPKNYIIGHVGYRLGNLNSWIAKLKHIFSK